MPSQVKVALLSWKAQTPFYGMEDWLFASPSTEGERPFWPQTLLQRHIHRAAERAGIVKVVGWHTLRRSFATLLNAQGTDVKVTQELMRHSSPNMTFGTYAQAVTEAKRQAQEQLASLILQAS